MKEELKISSIIQWCPLFDHLWLDNLFWFWQTKTSASSFYSVQKTIFYFLLLRCCNVNLVKFFFLWVELLSRSLAQLFTLDKLINLWSDVETFLLNILLLTSFYCYTFHNNWGILNPEIICNSYNSLQNFPRIVSLKSIQISKI